MKSLIQSFATWWQSMKRPGPVVHADNLPILLGDGTWPWHAYIDGDDIIVIAARATCFGGSNDPQDSGETASGFSTKRHPGAFGCSLPMDGRHFSGLSPAEHKALDGSPIPRLGQWPARFHDFLVEVTANGKTISIPVIDLGPGKRTGNALDLTIAAARHFKPGATATNFELRCDFRIKGAAKFVRGGSAQ